MADQTNPWGSAPSTDSAAQAADASGGASTAAPANGGGADWLHSAPAPQPEQFNIMDPFHKTLIPLDSWVTHAIDWIVLHFRPLFQGIRVPIDYILSAFQQLLLGIPAPVAIIVFALIAPADLQPRHGGRHSGIADCHRRHRRVVASHGHSGAGPHRPAVLHGYRLAAGDLASAQPAGGENHPPAVGCHADHAGVRLSGADRDAVRHRQRTGRGGDDYLRPAADRPSDHPRDKPVPADLIEASRSFGASPRQLLFKVQLPLAMPTIMAGVNQTLMLALSMVVIASMIAVGGLGQMVLRGIGRLGYGPGDRRRGGDRDPGDYS